MLPQEEAPGENGGRGRGEGSSGRHGRVTVLVCGDNWSVWRPCKFLRVANISANFQFPSQPSLLRVF